MNKGFFLVNVVYTLSVASLFWCAPAQAFQSYFINREVQADTIENFPKWTGMLERYDAASHKLDDVCGQDQYNECKLKDWEETLSEVRDSPIEKQMDAINRLVNAYPYVEDIVNWGIEDYWETPYEFQEKSGDCEDYAIAKFISLRALGVPNDNMRIEVVRDLNLGGIIHAILVVFVNGKPYVLDNQIKQVIPATDIYHYLPVYSINEKHWWQHFVQ